MGDSGGFQTFFPFAFYVTLGMLHHELFHMLTEDRDGLVGQTPADCPSSSWPGWTWVTMHTQCFP